MTLALNLGIGGLAMLAFLPLLGYMLYILAREWRLVTPGINATRIMMAVWSITFMLQVGWKLYAVWWRATGEDDPLPYLEAGSLATTVSLFVCAVMSLVTFILRQKSAADTHRHALLRDEDGEGEE